MIYQNVEWHNIIHFYFFTLFQLHFYLFFVMGKQDERKIVKLKKTFAGPKFLGI